MIIIYTGNGKGKTSASTGQALRAMGQNLNVAFGQFMKRDVRAGEQVMLAQLLGPRFHAGGSGFFRHEAERATHRTAALQTLTWARAQLPNVHMLVLDEALYALGCNLLLKEELEDLIQTSREHGVHLVLSGRGLPEWLAQEGDIITEMGEIKHAMHTGAGPIKGIEL